MITISPEPVVLLETVNIQQVEPVFINDSPDPIVITDSPAAKPCAGEVPASTITTTLKPFCTSVPTPPTSSSKSPPVPSSDTKSKGLKEIDAVTLRAKSAVSKTTKSSKSPFCKDKGLFCDREKNSSSPNKRERKRSVFKSNCLNRSVTSTNTDGDEVDSAPPCDTNVKTTASSKKSPLGKSGKKTSPAKNLSSRSCVSDCRKQEGLDCGNDVTTVSHSNSDVINANCSDSDITYGCPCNSDIIADGLKDGSSVDNAIDVSEGNLETNEDELEVRDDTKVGTCLCVPGVLYRSLSTRQGDVVDGVKPLVLASWPEASKYWFRPVLFKAISYSFFPGHVH